MSLGTTRLVGDGLGTAGGDHHYDYDDHDYYHDQDYDHDHDYHDDNDNDVGKENVYWDCYRPYWYYHNQGSKTSADNIDSGSEKTIQGQF